MPGYYGKKGREKRMAIAYLTMAHLDYIDKIGQPDVLTECMIKAPEKFTIQEKMLDSITQ